MHKIQKSILELFENYDKLPLKLRWIGREIEESHPQNIKYHLNQLEKRGLILIDADKKEVRKVKRNIKTDTFVRLPVFGTANCGSALSFAEDNVQGFIKISRLLLKRLTTSPLFALKATGDSMNKANIEGLNIESGDFVIIDKSQNNPSNGDYVVSIIEDCANIKRFHQDEEKITLISESTKDYLPIFIHEGDSYSIAGKVVKVIKTPKF